MGLCRPIKTIRFIIAREEEEAVISGAEPKGERARRGFRVCAAQSSKPDYGEPTRADFAVKRCEGKTTEVTLTCDPKFGFVGCLLECGLKLVNVFGGKRVKREINGLVCSATNNERAFRRNECTTIRNRAAEGTRGWHGGTDSIGRKLGHVSLEDPRRDGFDPSRRKPFHDTIQGN